MTTPLNKTRLQTAAMIGLWGRLLAAVFIWLALAPAAISIAQQGAPSTIDPASYATGLEASDGEQTTTAEQADELLTRVAADSPRVRYDQLGQSVQGRPIHLLRIGHPQPADDDQIAAGPTLLFIGAQHGNEPSGREGLLRLVRHLAFTDDEALVDQMSRVSLLVIPTANPDGFAASKRRNASNIDINRDHLKLQTPEARWIAETIQRFAPHIVVDAHEGGNPPNRPGETARLEALWPANLNSDPRLRKLNRQLILEHLFPAIEAAGFETRQWRGRGANEGVLRNMVGLRHSLGMVTETFRSTAAQRAEAQYQTMLEVLRFHRQHGDNVAKVVQQARQAYRADKLPYYFGGHDGAEPKQDQVDRQPPFGYLINRVQFKSLANHIELFGLQHQSLDNGAFLIPMAQPMRSVVPLLLDSRAPNAPVHGVAVPEASKLAQLEPPPLPPPRSPPAQHWIDLASVDAGSPGDAWTPAWRQSDWSFQGQPVTLRHQVKGRSARRALWWNTPGELRGDVEVYTKVQGESSNTLFQLLLHASGDVGQENAYYVDVRLNDGTVRINRYHGGRFSTLGNSKYSCDPQQWQHVRFRRQGDQLMVRIWPQGQPEPDVWLVKALDSSHDSGWVGFAGFQGDSVNHWALLGVGVGGQPAPGPTP